MGLSWATCIFSQNHPLIFLNYVLIQFYIDKIIACKYENNKKYYKVRWKGFTAADDTWEMRDHIAITAAFKDFTIRQEVADYKFNLHTTVL